LVLGFFVSLQAPSKIKVNPKKNKFFFMLLLNLLLDLKPTFAHFYKIL
jgi:hypothetical protein